MKAAQINQYGEPEVLQITDDAPKPSAGEGQVLVEVHAAGVNPWDCKVRSGAAQQWVQVNFPATLGGDVAGIVSEVGTGVADIQVGDEVFGQANSVGGAGSFAEFTPVSASAVALKPRSIDFTTAAAVPLAAASARQALVDHIGLQAGQKVLIHGGAGGIGVFAVQLAKQLGAYVATTVSTEDVDFAKQLGADEVIDYKNQDFTAAIKDFDAVFNVAGAEETTRQSFAVLKTGGMLVTMGSLPTEDLAKQHGVEAIAQQSHVKTEGLEAIAKLIDEGALKVYVDKTFTLDDAAAAMAYLESGSHRGKVVITVK